MLNWLLLEADRLLPDLPPAVLVWGLLLGLVVLPLLAPLLLQAQTAAVYSRVLAGLPQRLLLLLGLVLLLLMLLALGLGTGPQL